MKINKATGLVPVKVTAPHPSGIVMIGDVIGIPPARAKAYLDLGIVELVEIPADVETEALGEVEAEVIEPVQTMTTTETDWRKMKFMAKLKMAKELGYAGDVNAVEVNAFLEALEAPAEPSSTPPDAPAAILVTEDSAAATDAPAEQ